MDQIKKFTTNELIMLGGAVLIFIGAFLPWFKIDDLGFGAGGLSVNGFEYFLQGTIPWLLAIAVAGVLIATKLGNVELPELPMPLSQILLIVCGVIALLLVTRIVAVDGPNEIVDRGIGLFIATLGGILMAVGAFLKFQAKEEDTAGPSSAPPTPF